MTPSTERQQRQAKNIKERNWYNDKHPDILSRRMASRVTKRNLLNTNHHQAPTTQRRRMASLNDNRTKLRHFGNIFAGTPHTAQMHTVLLRRRQDASTDIHRAAGVQVEPTTPCRHCGALLSAKESKGLCCKTASTYFRVVYQTYLRHWLNCTLRPGLMSPV